MVGMGGYRVGPGGIGCAGWWRATPRAVARGDQYTRSSRVATRVNGQREQLEPKRPLGRVNGSPVNDGTSRGGRGRRRVATLRILKRVRDFQADRVRDPGRGEVVCKAGEG